MASLEDIKSELARRKHQGQRPETKRNTQLLGQELGPEGLMTPAELANLESGQMTPALRDYTPVQNFFFEQEPKIRPLVTTAGQIGGGLAGALGAGILTGGTGAIPAEIAGQALGYTTTNQLYNTLTGRPGPSSPVEDLAVGALSGIAGQFLAGGLKTITSPLAAYKAASKVGEQVIRQDIKNLSKGVPAVELFRQADSVGERINMKPVQEELEVVIADLQKSPFSQDYAKTLDRLRGWSQDLFSRSMQDKTKDPLIPSTEFMQTKSQLDELIGSYAEKPGIPQELGFQKLTQLKSALMNAANITGPITKQAIKQYHKESTSNRLLSELIQTGELVEGGKGAMRFKVDKILPFFEKPLNKGAFSSDEINKLMSTFAQVKSIQPPKDGLVQQLVNIKTAALVAATGGIAGGPKVALIGAVMAAAPVMTSGAILQEAMKLEGGKRLITSIIRQNSGNLTSRGVTMLFNAIAQSKGGKEKVLNIVDSVLEGSKGLGAGINDLLTNPVQQD